MAEQNDEKAKDQAIGDQDDAASPAKGGEEMTNVRHHEAEKLVAELKSLAENDKNLGFEIGDLVEKATAEYEIRVADLVEKVGLSRQRLCDCRMTAVAFAGKSRRKDIPFHFFTLAARAAQKTGIKAEDALKEVTDKGLESTREVSVFFAQKQRVKDNAKALEDSAMLVAKHGDLLGRCHHDDFRDVVVRLDAGSVKLVVADPPYDGKRKSTTSATARGIDGNSEVETQSVIDGMLKSFADKMANGGALVLFRPGAAMDPAWLTTAIETHGWACERALTWDKKKVKLGRTDAPYGIGSERILILCRQGDKLVGHDNSSRDDILDFKPIQPHRTDTQPHHQHEKPLDLMRHLIGKHTHEGELVVEPFGGSGPASQAAIEMGRHWVYCETKSENLNIARVRIHAAVEAQQKPAA